MPKEINLAIGARVRSARKEANLTQTQLGEKLGMTKQWVSAKERGQNEMTFEETMDVARVCNVDLDYFRP